MLRFLRFYRIRLRLMLLLTLAASLLLGWWGIKTNIWKIEAELAKSNTNWERLGKRSSIVKDGQGVLVYADVLDGPDMDLLLAKYDCSTVESLGLYSSDAVRKFQAQTFPRVKRLSLANIELSNERLAQFAELENLERLTLQQMNGETEAPQWAALGRMRNLKHLVLTVDANASFEVFPKIRSLRTITLNSYETTEEQVETLKARLPNCSIVNPHTYRYAYK